MTRVKYTTNLDEDLLRKAKEKAEQDGPAGDWIKKLIVRPGRVVVESIRSRTVRRGASRHLTDDALMSKGWTKVGQMKQG